MRFLKRKIYLKSISSTTKRPGSDSVDSFAAIPQANAALRATSQDSVYLEEQLLPLRKPRKQPLCADGNSKNIVKNYGRALCSFACSNVALPYLEKIVGLNTWDSSIIPLFKEYIYSKKTSISSIQSVRKLLIEDKEDTSQILAYKKMFKEISIVFLKFFVVNWIFGDKGKLLHKKAHLKFRYKMLRRVQNAEHFTYLNYSSIKPKKI